ncbi:unnamed protein product [Ixodes pacificus]
MRGLIGDCICGIFARVIEQNQPPGVLVDVVAYVVHLLSEDDPGVCFAVVFLNFLQAYAGHLKHLSRGQSWRSCRCLTGFRGFRQTAVATARAFSFFCCGCCRQASGKVGLRFYFP